MIENMSKNLIDCDEYPVSSGSQFTFGQAVYISLSGYGRYSYEMYCVPHDK